MSARDFATTPAEGEDHEPPSPLAGLVRAMLDRRVSELRIVVRGGGIVLRGRASSYHAKQLAQHAALSITELPLVANEIEVMSHRARATEPREEDPQRHPTPQAVVLLATGDDRLRSIARHRLSEHGYSVAIAAGGVECVSLLRDLTPSVGVLVLDDDLLWGGADGVLTHLRAGNATRLPAVLLTSRPVEPLEPPVFAVLEKPVSLETLLLAICSATERSRDRL